ncbi:MAG: 16S rRNA (guanine(966)-N(2))-methyltransferase RsmD [Firmicutes bacterium]|nr:16S rRNA (guanine(966)-N(2))-methyltransferase RsmD [Bacillota bacterium]
MRVIAGIYKGRKLESPENYDIRPTTDKAKEACFSILTEEIPGSRVLDLFAGTGALGIEALSRGASECVFVDHSRQSIGLIKRNLSCCGAGEQARVLAGDYRKVLAGLSGSFDIILMDPPYDKGLLDEAMRLVREHDLLAEDGVIICEHRKEEDLPEEIHGFVKQKERRYGIVKLSIYR